MRETSLLVQFESILESDPLIDDVGHIHPSQIAYLSADGIVDGEDTKFWVKDHKLEISTDIVLDLYKEAKDALLRAIEEFKRLESDSSDVSSLSDSLENEIMMHSKAVLLISSDFLMAWNSRKLIVSKKRQLMLSSLVLSYSPKSEQAWCHRRWVIKAITGECSTLDEIVNDESQLVEAMAERSKMNYRAWNHRGWLVSYMSKVQVLFKLKKTRNWAAQHVADNSCFHYRTRLLLRILEFCSKQDECHDNNLDVHRIWKIMKRFVVSIFYMLGRASLERSIDQAVHRSITYCTGFVASLSLPLSFYWTMHLAENARDSSTHPDSKARFDAAISNFLDYEFFFVSSCLSIPDSCCEDYQAQAANTATYILWLTNQLGFQKASLDGKLSIENLERLRDKAYPERSSLWSYLVSNAKASPLDLQDKP